MSEPKPTNQENEFLKAAGQEERGLIAEFWSFMAENKIWWLAPILIVFLLVGVLLVIGAGPMSAWLYSFV